MKYQGDDSYKPAFGFDSEYTNKYRNKGHDILHGEIWHDTIDDSTKAYDGNDKKWIKKEEWDAKYLKGAEKMDNQNLLSSTMIGKKILVNTNDWFFAPDGDNYKAVFGTFKGVFSDGDTLGLKTNSKSTNWYLSVGNMIIAGCQIYYVFQTERVNFDFSLREVEHEGKAFENKVTTRIYNADIQDYC